MPDTAMPNSGPGPILIRADASPAIGTGHVMRCLAVAEALIAAGRSCVLAAAELPEPLAERAAGMGVAPRRIAGPPAGEDDLAATLALAGELEAAALILDGYRFDEAWRARLAAAGRPVLLFDDRVARGALHADLVVNAAPAADARLYARVAPGAELLLGPAYAPLRAEFRAALAAGLPDMAARRSLLLTFGGSDPAGLTAPCLTRIAARLPAMAGAGPDRIDVAVGGGNPQAAAIEAAGAAFPDRVRIHRDARAMAALMATAGLAVSAGGGTTGELAAMRVPALLVIVADNQETAATQSAALGWCAVVDGRCPDAAERIAAHAEVLWLDGARRACMAERAGRLVDGAGATRIAAALLRRVAH